MKSGISLILPYWNRPRAAKEALDLIEKNYTTIDLEVMVVDDGSTPAFDHCFNPDSVPVLHILRLPEKKEAKCACVPFNRGVMHSSHDIVALSSVEILHRKPVLHAMKDELLRGNEATCVSAAVWSPDQNRWEAHSSLKRHFNFMTMMNRSLWEKAGGMDEDYRDGMSYDDADFLFRLEKAGVQFKHRDDLVVEHPHHGETKTRYPKESLERNRLLYESKW